MPFAYTYDGQLDPPLQVSFGWAKELKNKEGTNGKQNEQGRSFHMPSLSSEMSP